MLSAQVLSFHERSDHVAQTVTVPRNLLSVPAYKSWIQVGWDVFWNEWGPNIMFVGQINQIKITNCPYCGFLDATIEFSKERGCASCGANPGGDEHTFGYDPNTGWRLPMSKEDKVKIAKLKKRIDGKKDQPKPKTGMRTRRGKRNKGRPMFASQIGES